MTTSVKSALLVHVATSAHAEADASEWRKLALASGVSIAAELYVRKALSDAKYGLGRGKVEELEKLVQEHHPSVILVDSQLSPAQERNLQNTCKCPVRDRTGLILHIFGQRAQTFEGKLQVELAQLQHAATRLVRGWTHLERQTGGIGIRGGPGESQLELDRRQIRDKMQKVKKRLEKVRVQRALSRRTRARANIPLVSLVGYTNAGKSTLFNRLTQSSVYVANQLFATLDPTVRRLSFSEHSEMVIADTVGFIRDLPHALVDAFRATLEEVAGAHLLLHVIDATSVERQAQMDAVKSVLRDIDAGDVPVIEVYNKVDQLPDVEPHVDRDDEGRVTRIWLSAETGAGMNLLEDVLHHL